VPNLVRLTATRNQALNFIGLWVHLPAMNCENTLFWNKHVLSNFDEFSFNCRVLTMIKWQAALQNITAFGIV